MGDLGGKVCFIGDCFEFFDSFKGLIGFVAHVGNVEAIICSRGFSESDDFFGIAVVTGVVFKARAEPESTVAHILSDEGGHLFNLLCGGSSFVVIAENVSPDSAVTSKCGEVDRWFDFFKFSEQFSDWF